MGAFGGMSVHRTGGGKKPSAATRAKISASLKARSAGRKAPTPALSPNKSAAFSRQLSRAKPVAPGSSVKQFQGPKRGKTTSRVMRNIRSTQKARFSRVSANHPNLRKGTRPVPTHRQKAKAMKRSSK